ncbi:MAG TPA: thrombospondin type 3 repeat-containing protein, partial [Aggregatilineaceae bacterium]|nr:thrombospondin type 3 repeat-containing protein [Aggregatilineaceae bacterium]
MQLLTEQSPTSEIGQAAGKVIEAGAGMIVYYRTSSDEENSGGMSIYFPRNQELYGLDDHGTRYDEEAPTDLHSWRSFLKTFYSGLTLVYSSTTQGSVGDITAGKDGIAIALNFGSGEVSQAAVLVVLEVTPGQVIIVDYSRPSEIKDNQLNWGGKIPWLTNGHSSTPVLVMPSRANRGIVNGVFYPQAGKPVEAQVIFDLTTNRAVSVWGLRQTDSSIMPFEIKPQPGDIFQPFWLSPGRSSNALVPIPANTQFVFGDEPFELDWRSAPAGSYRLIVLFDNSTDERLTTLTNGDDGLTITTLDPNNPDMDGDLIPNEIDNCPGASNPSQIDTDGDGLGDECDPFGAEFDSDPDGDGIRNGDNCPALYNPDQADADHDGLGDACDFVSDACSLIYNSDPSAGCPAPTADTDQDGISDSQDNCPTVANANQADSDSDGMGDVCDSGGNGGTEGGSSDSDGDGILDGVDNCPTTANPDQLDADSDGIGNACDYTSPDIPEITVSSISRLAASPTSAATVTYSVAFSEAVSGLSTSNFTVVAPDLTGAAVASISGSDTTYTITVNVGSGDGALTLQMVDSTGVTGALGRPVSNVPFTGETYTIDKTPPMVSSITLVNTNPTNAATVSFTITYSEAVVGLTAANFALNTSGLSGTPAITSLSGSGASYTVTASTGSGNGWLGLNMVSTTGVADAAGNPFANLPFVGPTYTVDRTAPWVTSISLLDPTPTNAATVRYQVQFSEPVTG